MQSPKLMCPHCGSLFDMKAKNLVPIHYTGKYPCAGSEQIPRNPDSDARPLWNGKPNLWFCG